MLNKKIIVIIICVLAFLYELPSYASELSDNKFRHPFYVGLEGGYGSTTWGHLTPLNPDVATNLSTPTNVSEGGGVWGLFGGYEFLPQFALEANYMHYQAARLYFDPYSVFTNDYDGRTELTSRTESVSLMAKIMLIIPRSTIRAYSSVGVGVVHRYDAIKNIWRPNPAFGAGLNYNLTDHWMTEIGINYIAGYGEAELNPAKDFVPFVYSAFARLAYRF